MTALSVNVNKIAWLRNARGGGRPDVVALAKRIIAAGADGITVHPRADQRHITPADTVALGELVATERATYPNLEFNIEGNPYNRARRNGYPGFDALIETCRPEQCTLVPDADGQLTSDHGFDLLGGSNARLLARIRRYQALGARVSLFMDPVRDQISAARDCGVERIELYTGPYADAFAAEGENGDGTRRELARYQAACEHARAIGLGVNAGHDLDLDNLPLFARIGNVSEVSIGHALISDALELGIEETVERYAAALA
ncbi:MAG: pyridoxine 5'-phosphate synthase [Pseudomonadota bacterium]